MHRMNIAAKIWLSIGVFLFGYVLSTTLGQIQTRELRKTLRATSDALFPATQRSQDADASFRRMVKGFGDAVITQDSSGLDRAIEDGRQAAAALKSAASIHGLAAGRSEEGGKLAASLEGLLVDARSTYGAALSGDLTSELQERVRSLAARNQEMLESIARFKDQLANDLHNQLNALEARSTRQSSLALGVFVATLALSAVIVTMTIRRSITGPVARVITGVRHAADGAAEASVRMAESGMQVSKSAQEQAACIQETSASLEEISATTRQNADRAGEADRLMQEARQTVERASQAMSDLRASMDVVSKSSHQVAGVLKNIDEIAFRTNILALNAAVEAARAGQAGAGFSVVADEVRSLAHGAAEAARHSGAIVEQTVRDVARGVELVAHAHATFREVSDKISAGSLIVGEISASSGEQARGITSINQAITRIEGLTQRNVAHAQQTADGASAMTAQVESTREYLSELVAVVGLRN
jgi:methyl-accepting chemotaxis protein